MNHACSSISSSSSAVAAATWWILTEACKRWENSSFRPEDGYLQLVIYIICNCDLCPFVQNESLAGELQSVIEQLETVSDEKLTLVSSTCDILDLFILLIMKYNNQSLYIGHKRFDTRKRSYMVICKLLTYCVLRPTQPPALSGMPDE